MDPNETLKQIRELSTALEDMDENSDSNERFVEDFVNTTFQLTESFKALDEWIMNGGFLPEDWK